MDFSKIPGHMRDLGLGALSHANWHANYSSMENPYWPELSVLQAAHAAEILIKARIAEEHPLLIFETLPKPSVQEDRLTLEQLAQRGRTIDFADLPDRLWATTGVRIADMECYKNFARLRNTIQHFALHGSKNASWETINFIYKVIDPFIHDCWNLYAVDFNEDFDENIYIISNLINHEVLFLVSPEAAAADLAHMHVGWPKKNDEYRVEMEARFAAARAA